MKNAMLPRILRCVECPGESWELAVTDAEEEAAVSVERTHRDPFKHKSVGVSFSVKLRG